MPVNLHEFNDAADLIAELSARIARQLADAIVSRGVATLALSGGSTPVPLFQALSQMPLDWSRVIVTQVDERWVPGDHADSNARLIRESLLQNEAATARFESMKTDGDNAFAAEAAVAARLADFAEGIDVTVLGMGEDGHTASFFPAAETLARALDPAAEDLCLAVRPPVAPHDRMTLSLSALLRSRHLYLHIVGAEKRSVWQQALEPGEIAEMPIRAIIRQQQLPLEVYYAPRS